MKICPQCQKTYSDDNLRYCVNDGKPLSLLAPAPEIQSVEYIEPETVNLSESNPILFNLQEPPSPRRTDVQTNTEIVAQVKPRKSRRILLPVVACFVLILLGVIAGIIIWKFGKPSQNVAQNSVASNVSANVSANANTANANLAMPTPTPTPKPTLKPAEIDASKKEVESALYGWKSSAENHNLDANLSNYADKFS